MSDETAEEPDTIEPESLVEKWRKKNFFSIPWNQIRLSGHLTALAHFLVIAVMLAAVNWLFAKSDPGWLHLNPSPWVILPFYLGFRFGIFWGITSGLTLLVIRTWMAIATINPDLDEPLFTGSEYFLLWGAVLMGAIGGFASGVIRRREEQKQRLLDDTVSSSENLKNQVALLKHNEQDLSAALVAQGLDTSGLVLSLQDVIDHYAKEDRDEAFLNLLKDRCGVKSAAIFYSARDGRALRVAQLRSDGAFPESMEKTPMFQQAEHTGKIVTQRWFWEPFEPNATGGLDDYFLAVVAHPKDQDFRVLVISRMEFEQIHWENFWKLESAFRWYENAINFKTPITFHSTEETEAKSGEETREATLAEEISMTQAKSRETAPLEPGELVELVEEVEEEIAESKPILDAREFKQRLAQVRQIEEQMGLDYRLVILVPGEGEPPERCDAFVQSLNQLIPPTDDLAKIPSDGGRFVYGLITTAPNSREAEEYASKLLEQLPQLDLRFFVLQLNDNALAAFES